MIFDGIILIDKDKDWTSHDVVAKVRNTLRKKYFEECGEKKKIKTGHCGTLDPLATGLIVVVVGSYTKRASDFSKLDKVYEVEMKLGETSSTGDEEGEKTKVSAGKPSQAEVKKVLSTFLGKSMQTPPVYSAVKIDGKRAYKLAREGKKVELEPREIEIYNINLTNYEYPMVNFMVHVSSGTYIRSLVEDIGKQLGVGAYMFNLHRTKIGDFEVEDSGSVNSTLQITENSL